MVRECYFCWSISEIRSTSQRKSCWFMLIKRISLMSSSMFCLFFPYRFLFVQYIFQNLCSMPWLCFGELLQCCQQVKGEGNHVVPLLRRSQVHWLLHGDTRDSWDTDSHRIPRRQSRRRKGCLTDNDDVVGSESGHFKTRQVSLHKL